MRRGRVVQPCSVGLRRVELGVVLVTDDGHEGQVLVLDAVVHGFGCGFVRVQFEFLSKFYNDQCIIVQILEIQTQAGQLS